MFHAKNACFSEKVYCVLKKAWCQEEELKWFETKRLLLKKCYHEQITKMECFQTLFGVFNNCLQLRVNTF